MLIGKMYTLEFLVSHEARCYENFRMKDMFMNYCETLKNVGNLRRKRFSIEEAIVMFLIIVFRTCVIELLNNFNTYCIL